MMFANALYVDRYALKKVNNSASLGVGAGLGVDADRLHRRLDGEGGRARLSRRRSSTSAISHWWMCSRPKR